jgi:sec-independent protein translocase protein TatB
MDFLGIGPLELIFILLIALIVLGPKDMVKAGRSLGRALRKIVMSPTWQVVQKTSRDLRYLPNKLIREAGLEELKESLPTSEQIQRQSGLDDLQKEIGTINADLRDWTTPPQLNPQSESTETTDTPETSPTIASPPPPSAIPDGNSSQPEPTPVESREESAKD